MPSGFQASLTAAGEDSLVVESMTGLGDEAESAGTTGLGKLVGRAGRDARADAVAAAMALVLEALADLASLFTLGPRPGRSAGMAEADAARPTTCSESTEAVAVAPCLRPSRGEASRRVAVGVPGADPRCDDVADEDAVVGDPGTEPRGTAGGPGRRDSVAAAAEDCCCGRRAANSMGMRLSPGVCNSGDMTTLRNHHR